MLINNLGSLKAELGRYMFQQRFQPDYDTAIANFEAVANRRLRVRPMEAIAIITTVAGGAAALPLDYLLWRTLLWPGRTPYVELDYVHPAYLTTSAYAREGGDPQIFSIEGAGITIYPAREDTYHLHYYQKIPSVNGNDNNFNWLIAAHPDLYLHGCLHELFVLGRNGEAAVAHKQLRDEKMAELIQLSALTTGATSSKVRSETAEYF
jgi:hypothetical protein